MDATNILNGRGQYFVLRYRPNAARDEERNVGIALVAESGEYAAVKHLAASQLAERLREQGILDSALISIARAVSDDRDGALNRLASLSVTLHGALVVSEPRPADLGGDPRVTLDTLFRALVAHKTARRPGIPKARLLDKIVDTLRIAGTPVRRGQYLDDYLMDAVVLPARGPITALHAQSFALASREWARAEQETGFFLYAVDRLHTDAFCIVQPPTDVSNDEARRSFERVDRWIRRSGVAIVNPSDIKSVAHRFEPEEQLPLLMA